MLFWKSTGSDEAKRLAEAYGDLKERSDLLDATCGVGLWEAVLHNGDAMHQKSLWRWSPEFRRLLGFESEADFPHLVGSWSDRLHPDDVAPTFAAFAGHLEDKSGRSRYDVTYRLRVRDGSYRWFRATGGCRHASQGGTVRACGSLTDIHDQKLAQLEIAEKAAEVETGLSLLTAALSALADGDLTHRIAEELSGSSAAVKSAFNSNADKLLATIRQITGSAEKMHVGAQEIFASTDNLAKRTEQQAASLEETAAALDEITATVKKTAEGARHAAQLTASARVAAQKSGDVVSQAIAAVSGISKSSQEISQIIGVIDEIAFQTNLLALNAGVEAARAGEAGRGFAVVASEVRGLAQRSAEAAKEIKTLISTSATHVAQGVELVGATGASLERILTEVAEITGVVDVIASSAQEQSTALQEVNTAITSMDQVTQQNAAMVEQSTAAAHELFTESDSLGAIVARFKLGADGRAAPARSVPSAPAPVAGRPRPAAPAALRPSVRTMSGKRTASAVAKREVAEADDNWEEF